MRRTKIIGLGGLLAAGFALSGAWALAQGQTAPAASNQPKGAGRSSDSVGNVPISSGATSSPRAEPRGGSVNDYTQYMMRAMQSTMSSGDDPEMAELAEAEGE